MIRKQYVSGSTSTLPFRIRVDGAYVALGSYSVDFKGQANNASAISVHLSASSASATQIDVSFASILQSANVVRGRFFIVNPSGDSEPPSEFIQIVAR